MDQPAVFSRRRLGRGRPIGPVRSVYIPMRDGVRIALDIVAPMDRAPDERLTTVLSMTRYWRGERGSGPGEDAQLYTPRGFVTVVGDVRGTGASFGVWTHHRSRAETRDFGEIIDWIAVQPWSNGKVIGVGNSYAGNTADWMAEQHRPALVGIVPRFPDYDPYSDLYFPGGVPNAFMGRTWGGSVKALDLNHMPGPGGAKSLGVRPVDEDRDARELKSAIAARAAVPSVWEGLKAITFRDDRPVAWGGESMDDWGIHSHAAAVEASGTPIQTWAGWMDAGTANGALHRFMTLTDPMRVYIGAWSHGGVHDAQSI
jgi:putative CocE/NonD family hydrolase